MRQLHPAAEHPSAILIDDQELKIGVDIRAAPTSLFFTPRLDRGDSWSSVSGSSALNYHLPSAVIAAVESTPREYRPALWGNIVLTGGNALMSGLRERLRAELTASVEGFEVHVTRPEVKSDLDFLNMAWIGTSKYASNPLSQNRRVGCVVARAVTFLQLYDARGVSVGRRGCVLRGWAAVVAVAGSDRH